MAIPAPELVDIRKKYTAQYDPNPGNGWRKGKVTVFRDGQPIYTYERNYSMLKTFEPFRQLQFDGKWHEYALISPRYTTFQVLDLEKLEVVAERPYPQRDWYRTEKYDQYESVKKEHPDWFEAGGYYEGKGPNDKINGEGFCPMEFYVPDFLEEWTGDDAFTEETWAEHQKEDWFREDIQHHIGMYGFVGGCIWGDDSSMKVRYIDLSKISEGIVTEEERFGYLEAPDHLALRDMITVNDYGLRMQIPVTLSFSTGKISPYSIKHLNTAKDDNDYYGFDVEARRAEFAKMTPEERAARSFEERSLTPLDEM